MKRMGFGVRAAVVPLLAILSSCSDDNSGSSQNITRDPQARNNAVLGRGEAGFDINPAVREIRTVDGSNNNVDNPDWGATFAQLRRIGPVDYADGVSALAGPLRPSAREISNIVVDQGSDDIPNSFGTSDYIWQWGQFLDHDLGLTDGILDEGPNGRDFDIQVPAGDPFFDPSNTGTQVIEFNRALFDPSTGDGVDNPRQQENEITSWIDASLVYGSDIERFEFLRVGEDSALMKLDDQGLPPRNTVNLPNANGNFTDPSALFVAGDVRANEQVGLLAMHILFVREHNRLAELVTEAFPLYTPNEAFFVARRLLGAEMQIITYNEFLPALIGPDAIPPYAGYNENRDGSLINEFTVAAYRFGHSALSPVIRRVNAAGQDVPEGGLALRDAFFASQSLVNNRDDIDPVLRGLALQRHQRIDAKVIGDLRNFLFGPPGAGGLDLASLNIQRGRDHGVPSYNGSRIALGLPPAQDFDDISSDPEIQQRLRQAYGVVDEVDLWVGGLAEDPLTSNGSQLGELFRRILIIQFTRLRDGDRFWYERDLSPEERALIEGITLADIIRLNTSIGDELPDDVFRVPQ